MTSRRVSAAGLIAAALVAPAMAGAQAPSSGRSWVEAGAFHHRVNHGFGSWTGGYARAVLAGARDVWYLDVRAQEAFRDRGVYGSIANVHTFGGRLYTQLGVGGGTGDYVLPELRADGSLHLKLGSARKLILSAGGTYVRSKSIYRDAAGFAALSWYAGEAVLLELGGRLNWSDPDAVRSARAHGSLTLGRVGSASVILRGSAGTEGYQLTSAPATLQRFRSQEVGVVWRQWLGRRTGTVLGAEWYHNPFYSRAGVMLGLFRAW